MDIIETIVAIIVRSVLATVAAWVVAAFIWMLAVVSAFIIAKPFNPSLPWTDIWLSGTQLIFLVLATIFIARATAQARAALKAALAPKTSAQ